MCDLLERKSLRTTKVLSSEMKPFFAVWRHAVLKESSVKEVKIPRRVCLAVFSKCKKRRSTVFFVSPEATDVLLQSNQCRKQRLPGYFSACYARPSLDVYAGSMRSTELVTAVHSETILVAETLNV